MGKLGGGFTFNNPKEKRAQLDFYPTPKAAVDVLLRHVKLPGEVWECAAGAGDLSKHLEQAGLSVYSSDIRIENVYGDTGVDFLQSCRTAEHIVTNPPFIFAEQFIQKALELSSGYSCFLLRLAFMESEKRFQTLYSKHPPEKVVVISRRLPFFDKGRWVLTGSTFPHAWFCWRKGHNGPTQLLWDTFVGDGI